MHPTATIRKYVALLCSILFSIYVFDESFDKRMLSIFVAPKKTPKSDLMKLDKTCNKKTTITFLDKQWV